MHNTLYSVGRLPFLVDFAVTMRDRLAWNPRYWITQPDLHNDVGSTFPQAIRHPFKDANRGVPAPDCNAFLGAPLDPLLLDRCATLEYSALQIIDRHILANSLSPAARRAFLYRQLGYCLRVVDELKLTRFVLNSTPHSIIDVCFYIACRLRGAELRMLHLTGFRGMQVVLDDAEQRPLGIDTTLRTWTDEPGISQDLSEPAERELATLSNTADPVDPWYVTAQRDKETKFKHLYEAADLILDLDLVKPSQIDLSQPIEINRSQLGSRKAVVASTIETAKNFFMRRPNSKKIGIPGSAFGKINIFARRSGAKHDAEMERTFARPGAGFDARNITWREYYIYRDWALLKKRALQRNYEALTTDFDITRIDKEQYVYFPLHYQPERTTCPEGGRFNDQYLAAAVLANAMPDDWTLLIKEHPSQFLWQTEGELGRTQDYYQQFLNLPRASFVPLNVSSHTLMTNAGAVATITGMAGWECCARGRPVIVFGEPWYASCEGVFAVKSVRGAETAFEQIASGKRPDLEKTRRFAAVVENVGRRCYMNPSHKPHYPELSDEDNCAALVELFAQAEKFANETTEG